MIILLFAGLIMVGISIMFCYLELLPFLDTIKSDLSKASTFSGAFIFPVKVILHIPKLIPSAIDLFVTVFLSGSLGFGGGLIGGITGLFASNLISIVIYFHTHIRRRYA